MSGLPEASGTTASRFATRAKQASSTPPTTGAFSDQMLQVGAGRLWTSLGQSPGLQMAWRRLPVFRSDMRCHLRHIRAGVGRYGTNRSTISSPKNYFSLVSVFPRTVPAGGERARSDSGGFDCRGLSRGLENQIPGFIENRELITDLVMPGALILEVLTYGARNLEEVANLRLRRPSRGHLLVLSIQVAWANCNRVQPPRFFRGACNPCYEALISLSTAMSKCKTSSRFPNCEYNAIAGSSSMPVSA